MTSSAALASQASSIFDILNLSFTRGAYPNPDSSHRYYLCQEPSKRNRMGPYICEQVKYARVMEFLKQKETIPTNDVVVPIEQTNPRVFDQGVLAYKLWGPAIILPSK